MKAIPRTGSCAAALVAVAAACAINAAVANHYILPCRNQCVAKVYPLQFPGAVTTDAVGNVYFSTPNIVFKLDGDGMLSVVAGDGTAGYAGDGGPATEALLNFPRDYPELAADPTDFSELTGPLAVDSAGNLYIADAYNNRVRKVDVNGAITTVAGNGGSGRGYGGDAGDGGHATDAQVTWPQGVAVDATGNLYIASAYGTLRKVTADGVIATLASPNCGPGWMGPGLCAPEQIAAATNGDIYVADGICRVRVVKAYGNSNTFAGDGNCGYFGDGGNATLAAMRSPYSVALDAAGNVYIADTYNSCIRKVDSAGIITTFAGRCTSPGYSGDGGPATSATLNLPHGVAVDATGNVFVADSANNCIRVVSPDGTIKTVAGSCGPVATEPQPRLAVPPLPETGTSRR